jgi:2-polyprenyl-6-methoxyphenol hydroxylase-like FAD-dependent oxidoreductase
MSTQIQRHQVVVVGARCAGAATAMLLVRAGHDVVMLDRSAFPSDTVSTHGIARGGVVQLSRWGLLDDVHESGAPPVREVLFRCGEVQTVRRVKHRAGVDHLVGPRRYALDALLQDAALQAGATLRTGVTVTGIRRRAGRRVIGVDGHGPGGEPVAVEADFVVAADGVRSRMARWLGAETLRSSLSRTGTFYTYVADVPLETATPAYEFHVARDAFAGIFPTNHRMACVWFIGPTRALTALSSAGAHRGEALLSAITAASPSLGARVRSGRVEAPVRGSVDLPNIVRRPIGGPGAGWALVGDAGYHRDPITGHGITDAFRDAELLANALDLALRNPGGCADEALAVYQTRRDLALRETFDLTRALSTFPRPERFVELQIQLSDALEREAADLAAQPAPLGAAAVA